MADSAPPPGSEYELLTQRLMEALGKQAAVETTELKHLKKFVGTKTGTQLTIDIWWEFHHAGLTNRLAFQCKDWGSTIQQEHVYAFRAVLDDLPGSPRGVMVTKTGYQKGARLVAKGLGITILELRHPTDADWQGRVKDVHVTLVSVFPQSQNFTLMIPEDYPSLPEALPTIGGFMEEMLLVDRDGNRVKSLREIRDLYVPEGFEATDWKKVTHRLDEPLYLEAPDALEDIPRLPVVGVSFEVRMVHNEQVISLLGDDLVKYVLRDTLGEDFIAFGADELPRASDRPAKWLEGGSETDGS